MILKDKTGKTYAVHFTHQDTELPAGDRAHWTPKRWNNQMPMTRQTLCTIHEGMCAQKKRPCGTSGAVTGVAVCSIRDHFCRATGRKVAFGRAVKGYEWSVRAALWTDFLIQSGVIGRM